MIDVISGGRLISGFVRGIGAEYHTFGVEPDLLARPLPRGARPDRARVDRAGAVRVPRPALQRAVREPLAAALPEAASADLDPVAGLARRRSTGRRIRTARYTYLQTFSPVKVVQRYLKMYRDTCSGYGYAGEGQPARLGGAGLRRRDRRVRAPRGEAALRGLPQRLRAHAARDAAAAGLHLARVAEERDEGEGADVRRRDASSRRSSSACSSAAAPRRCAQGLRGLLARDALRQPARHVPVRHAAGRSHARQHGALRARRDAEA